MAVYNIVTDDDPVLRKVAKPISEFNEVTDRLMNNLKDTLASTETGVGLAAPQIGISKRAIVVSYEDVYIEMFNPEIVEFSKETEEGWEGCLSVPGKEGLVPRYYSVKARYYDRFGNHLEVSADGFVARIIQHEIDHLNGILFTDKAVELEQK